MTIKHFNTFDVAKEEKLEKKVPCPLITHNENFSSFEARSRLKEKNKLYGKKNTSKKQKGTDSTSALVILEEFLKTI